MTETITYPYEMENVESGSTILHNSENGKVLLPAAPLVPPDGGVNLTVIPSSEIGPYFSPDTQIGDTLPAFLASLATARAIMFEPSSKKVSKYSQWVNVHAIPRFGGESHLQFEVIGKNAMNEKAWAMPVKYPKEEGTIDEEYPGYSKWGVAGKKIEGINYEMYPVVTEEIDQIKSQLAQRENDVTNESQNVTLFDEETPAETQHDEKCILTYKNFDIMMAKANPHVKEGGLHLWVNETSKRKTEGVQSDMKNAFEQFILASAIAKSIFAETGRKIEIHFSSNWGLPSHLQQEEAIAQGKDPEAKYIKESLTAHANLYAAPPEIDWVDLPERPIYSNPEIPQQTREIIQAALEQNLTGYLQPFENKKISEVMNLVSE